MYVIPLVCSIMTRFLKEFIPSSLLNGTYFCLFLIRFLLSENLWLLFISVVEIVCSHFDRSLNVPCFSWWWLGGVTLSSVCVYTYLFSSCIVLAVSVVAVLNSSELSSSQQGNICLWDLHGYGSTVIYTY
jgi:hypothetical protein